MTVGARAARSSRGGARRRPRRSPRTSPCTAAMETELRLMIGDDVYDEIVKYCDSRLEAGSPPMAHPAEVKVSLGRTRHPSGVARAEPRRRERRRARSARRSHSRAAVASGSAPDARRGRVARAHTRPRLGRARHGCASRRHGRDGDRDRHGAAGLAQRSRRRRRVDRRRDVPRRVARPAPERARRARLVGEHGGGDARDVRDARSERTRPVGHRDARARRSSQPA